jgi:hypothetical protein
VAPPNGLLADLDGPPAPGKKFLVVITLSAVDVKERFESTFENLGKDKPLSALTMR